MTILTSLIYLPDLVRVSQDCQSYVVPSQARSWSDWGIAHGGGVGSGWFYREGLNEFAWHISSCMPYRSEAK